MYILNNGAVINTKTRTKYEYGARINTIRHDGIKFSSLNKLAYYLAEGKLPEYPVTLDFPNLGFVKGNFRNSNEPLPFDGKFIIRDNTVTNTRTGVSYTHQHRLTSPLIYNNLKFFSVNKLAYYLTYGYYPMVNVELNNVNHGYAKGNFKLNGKIERDYFKICVLLAYNDFGMRITDGDNTLEDALHPKYYEKRMRESGLTELYRYKKYPKSELDEIAKGIYEAIGYSYDTDMFEDRGKLAKVNLAGQTMYKKVGYKWEDMTFGDLLWPEYSLTCCQIWKTLNDTRTLDECFILSEN